MDRTEARRELARMQLELLDVTRFNIRQLRVGKGHRFGGRWAKAVAGEAETPERKYRLPRAPDTGLGDAVRRGHVESDVPLSGGNAAQTSLVTYAGGRKTVRKKLVDYHSELGDVSAQQQGDAEQLTSLLAAAVGAHAPTVHRDAPDVVHMEHVDGDTGAALDFHEQRDQFHSQAGQLLGLLDLLTNNNDRHEYNWIRANAEPHGVDHSFAWMDTDSPETLTVDSPFVDAHFGSVVDGWRNNPMSRHELEAIRARVESLRADFDRLGRGDWLDYALARLAQVRARATDDGTVDSDETRRIRRLLDALPTGPDLAYATGAGGLVRTKDAALEGLRGQPGAIHAVRLPHAPVADEDALYAAARELWPDLRTHFGADTFPPDLARDPDVRQHLADQGYAGVEFRSPDTNYEPAIILWQPPKPEATVDIPEHDRHVLEPPAVNE